MDTSRRVLLFGGTLEGRKLAEYLNEKEISSLVCVATEYGADVLPEMSHVTIQQGRLDENQMEALMLSQNPALVLDATHPYADVVSANIRQACERLSLSYIRVLRNETGMGNYDRVRMFADVQTAAEWLETQSGTMLLTTGLKELPEFAESITDRSRIYARVLLQDSLFEVMERYDLAKKQIICMQGPFSKELNIGMLKQIGASYLVTKESGKAGGFEEKYEAAVEAGVTLVVIARPVKEQGISLEEAMSLLEDKFGPWESEGKESEEASGADHQGYTNPDGSFSEKTENGGCKTGRQCVSLVGIGMGSYEGLTLEAVNACREADCIIGADRMLDTLSCFGKPQVSMYLSDRITDYCMAHPEYRRIVVGLSGDVGFYSGAKKLTDKLQQAGMEVKRICGISSVVAFAARLHTAWEDMTLISTHGRNQNLIGAVRTSPKVFTLLSKADSVRALAQDLMEYGLSDVTMHVGTNLSYPEEAVSSGTPADFINYEIEGNSVALIENKAGSNTIVTPGIPDDEFIRGKVPMTKEEVRTVSISKMKLTKDAVIYDIGAGTGSVSVECARIAADGSVYAIERKEEALMLILQNKKKFGTKNVSIVASYAPDGFEELPAPTHAFIGGSGGNLRDIIEALYQKNPAVRIVINCIALETLTETLSVLKELGIENADISSISVAKAKELAGYHMMMGSNPVYVIAFGGQEC